MHRAARVEDAFHAWRARRARKRGFQTTIVPYTGYGNGQWVRVLCRVVLTRSKAPARQRAEKVRGWRSFFSIPVSDAVVRIAVDGTDTDVPVERGGVLDTRVPAMLAPGWHTVTLSTADIEPVTAAVHVVAPDARFGLISDVDDTVMVTALPRPLLAGWNTFVLDEHARRPVPGMAVLYERLVRANPGAPVVYLSTGAWNVAPTLSRFLWRHLYPRGPLLLTDWGPTHDRWFRSGREHKRSSLVQLAEDFPGIRWLLVGDDGQHDEEIYSEFVATHPDHVFAVAIRQLSTGEAVLAGGRKRAGDHPSAAPWVYAPDGAGLWQQLQLSGIVKSS